MCGINLIFGYGDDAPPVDEAAVLATRDAMQPRGPDGAGLWVDEGRRVGLGHRRLAIIDLSEAGAQPMHTADGKLTITYNGEIYNYRELKAELEAEGVAFHSDSDTEVMLHLYRRDGPAMLECLRGMFALAIWDADKQGMLLARDPFGIKPLYMADDGRTLSAASQVKALIAGGVAPGSANPAGHVGFFLLGYVPEPHTLHANITALPAGHWRWIDRNGGDRTECYADIARIVTEATPATDSANLAAALADSVTAHLVADVPVGVFLSAGLDSTTIAALATQSAKTSLRTVTLGFEEFKGSIHDEVPLAEEMARALGSDHTTVWVSGSDFAEAASDVLAAMDQPSIDGVNSYFVAKVTAGTGLKVALSGLGGDELFAGYPSFQQVPALVSRFGWLGRMGGPARLLRRLTAPVAGRLTSPKYAGVAEYADSIARGYFLRRSLYMPWELASVLDRDMVRQGLADLGLDARMARTANGARPRQALSALELSWYMRSQLLRDADWAGMAHSLEVRVPLVDIALLRTVTPLIASRNPPGKRDMAAAPATPLPDAILNRPKTGFSVPVRDWLMQGALADAAATADSNAQRGLRGWSQHVYRHAAGQGVLG